MKHKDARIHYNIIYWELHLKHTHRALRKTQGKVTVFETNILDFGFTRYNEHIQKVTGDCILKRSGEPNISPISVKKSSTPRNIYF